MKPAAIALVTDAFGGRGGIALYNRHFLRAVCSYPGFSSCEAFPRSITYELEEMPANLQFHTELAGSGVNFAKAVAARALVGPRPAIILCAHLHLLPFAETLAVRYGCPVLPLTYGVDAWTPTRHTSSNILARRLKDFISIRKFTAARFREWTGNTRARFHYLPNCIDLGMYGPGPKRADLLQRYGLEGRTVIMTVGRMQFTPNEVRKGFDEVIGALPLIAEQVPDVSYLIMGDGDDRGRLEDMARSLGVADRVVFTGYVKEAEKSDHYRLADVVAMPGSNPRFDTYPFRFAFLEPLACGIPVVGARLTDPSEVDDPDAKELIVQVDPSDPRDITRGIMTAMASRSGHINPRLKSFSFETFEESTHRILDAVLSGSGTVEVAPRKTRSAVT